MHYSFSELPTPRKRRNIEVSHFGNLKNKQKMRGVHRLHQLNMRIFKVKKSHEKSRRYVKQRIYGFSVFSEICTFVQRGVETDDTRRILCLRKLKSSTHKKVRQCDRNAFLTFRFSGSFQYFAVLSGVFNVITYTVFPSVLVRQCDNATGTIF